MATRRNRLRVETGYASKNITYKIIRATYKQNMNPIIAAGRLGKIEWLKILIKSGHRVNVSNRHGNMALTDFIDNWHRDMDICKIAEIMIRAGYNVNAIDRTGETALMKLASGRLSAPIAERVTRIMVSAKADVNKGGCYYTPLAVAISRNNIEISRMLIKMGADVNGSQDFNVTTPRFTPLMKACWHGHIKGIKLLIDANASIDHRDSKGATALSNTLLSTLRLDRKIEIAVVLLQNNANIADLNYRTNYLRDCYRMDELAVKAVKLYFGIKDTRTHIEERRKTTNRNLNVILCNIFCSDVCGIIGSYIAWWWPIARTDVA